MRSISERASLNSTTHSTGNCKTSIVILVLSYFSCAFSFVPQFLTKLYPYCLSTPSHFILTLIFHNNTTLIEAQISIERSISLLRLFTPQVNVTHLHKVFIDFIRSKKRQASTSKNNFSLQCISKKYSDNILLL